MSINHLNTYLSFIYRHHSTSYRPDHAILLLLLLLSILSKDRVVQKDKPVGVLPTKSTYTPEITKTMT